MAKPVEITDANFAELVGNSDKPVLVDFWAAWCGPCRAIGPIINDLANELDGQAVIGKLDVDANPETSIKFQVTSIPTLLVFKGGELVDRMLGAAPRTKIAGMLEKHMEPA